MSRLQPIFHRHLALAAAFMVFSLPAMHAQQTDNQNQDKHLDIRSSAGDLHMGNDADARDTGLPLYPGARARHNDDNKNTANIAIATAAFGMKLVVVNFDSDDAPGKVIAYYRDKLKKYGKVSRMPHQRKWRRRSREFRQGRCRRVQRTQMRRR